MQLRVKSSPPSDVKSLLSVCDRNGAWSHLTLLRKACCVSFDTASFTWQSQLLTNTRPHVQGGHEAITAQTTLTPWEVGALSAITNVQVLFTPTHVWGSRIGAGLQASSDEGGAPEILPQGQWSEACFALALPFPIVGGDCNQGHQ